MKSTTQNTSHKVLFTRENELTKCVEDVIFDCETRKIKVLDSIPFVLIIQMNKNSEAIYNLYSAGSQFGCGVRAIRLYGQHRNDLSKAIETLTKIFKAIAGEAHYGEEVNRCNNEDGLSRDGDLLSVLPDGDESTEALVRLEERGQGSPSLRDGAQEGAEGKVVPFSKD